VLQPGDTAIDGGAHSGKHTIPMARAVGHNGRIFAFEPSPEPYGRLSTNLEQSGATNVTAIQKAVSVTADDDVTFLVFPERPGVSGFQRRTDAAGQLEAEEITVRTTTLDAYAGEIGNLGFVKLDVEGAELHALLGGREVIGHNRPVVHVEASYVSWDAFGYGPREFLAYAREYGYSVVDMIGESMNEEAALDLSFRTAGVWDYLMIPNDDRGALALRALREHTASHYGISPIS
jgi:FkbM family methyltransferase